MWTLGLYTFADIRFHSCFNPTIISSPPLIWWCSDWEHILFPGFYADAHLSSFPPASWASLPQSQVPSCHLNINASLSFNLTLLPFLLTYSLRSLPNHAPSWFGLFLINNNNNTVNKTLQSSSTSTWRPSGDVLSLLSHTDCPCDCFACLDSVVGSHFLSGLSDLDIGIWPVHPGLNLGFL